MKKIMTLLLVLCMIFALCACGGAAPQTAEEKPAETVEAPADNAPLMKEPLTLKFCCSESADTSYVIIMNQAFDRITAATNGEIKFESYPSNQLGNIADTLEQMRSGAPMIVSSGFSEIADIASPRFLVTALPYVFEDMSEILTLAHTEWIEDINADVEAAGMEALCYGTQGYRHFISTKPIENAASIKGMIVRMGPSATSQNFVTVMDGTPTTSTWSDNYSLLQTGVIDACEANLELMYNSSLYEVCDYLSLSGHLASPFMCTMNLSIFADIKLLDEQAHICWTGSGNRQILSNLEKLKADKTPFIIRTPIIPGVNDREEEIKNIAEKLRNSKNLCYYELLSYNALGNSKGSLVNVPDIRLFEALDPEKARALAAAASKIIPTKLDGKEVL